MNKQRIIVAYDISNDKLRTRFSKFLEQYGIRLQYSLFEIQNSSRVLQLILAKIEGTFEKQFKMTDSILIFKTDDSQTIKYGNAIHRDQDIVFI